MTDFMNAKFTLELDEEFLELFYMEAGELPPSKENATLADLKRALEKIKNLHGSSMIKKENTFGAFTNDDSQRKVLIVDDLGVITYQLSVLFCKQGYGAVCSQEIYDAISKYKKQHYDIVILDLFIPTEREGFLLLDELIKINSMKQKRSKIGIITASNKKEHKQACKERGADFYVEKADDWQKNLIEMCTRLNEENN